MSHNEASEVVDVVAKEEVLVIVGDEERREKLSDMLKSNNSADAVRVVRSLMSLQKSRQKRGNKLHSADERMLRLAKKMVDDELSYSLEIAPEDVADFIKERIKD